MLGFQTTKQKISPWGDDHPEKLKQTSGNTIGFNQQLKGLVNPSSFLDQMFGGETPEAPFTPRGQKEKRVKHPETLVFSATHRENEQAVQHETKQLLEQLKQQVTLLERSEKALTAQITKIKVEQLPKKTGIYYLRFFEWLIGVVKQLRVKVEEGRAWLSTFTNRKKKKAGYWQMYKKHGTTFGLSNERNLSTQTG